MTIASRYGGWNTPDSSAQRRDVVIGGKRRLTVGDDTSTVTQEGAAPGAVIMGTGTSTTRLKVATAEKFKSFYQESTVTSGESVALYDRLYVSGAGGEGIGARIFTTVNDVAATNARGAHISLSYGTSGTVTGLGAAIEATLHVPSTAGMAGTNYAIKAAINSDAATSDPAGATSIAFFGVVNQGDATGAADVDDDAVLFDLSGFTSGAAKMWYDNTSNAADEFIKVRTPSGIRYLVLSDSTTFS